MSDGNTTDIFLDGNSTDIFLDADDFVAADDLYETDDWPAYLTWIQKVFATLSIICSYVVCRELVSDMKSRHGRQGSRNNRIVPLQRSIAGILLNVSISDMIFSFAVFLGEWMAPKDTWYIHHAEGNVHLCTFQGWLRALGYLASPMFSVALNAFYLLLIRYRWQDSELSRLEKKVIVGIWTYAIILSIIPIPLQAYNSDWDVCWIVPSPLDCLDDECTRGLIANKLEIFYSFVHIWSCMLISIFLMLLLFVAVRRLEDKSRPQFASTTGGAPVAISSLEPTTDETVDAENRAHKSLSQSTEAPLSDQNKKKKHSKKASVMSDLVKRISVQWFSEISENVHDHVQGHLQSVHSQMLSSAHVKSRAVAYQGILFTLAFMSTHLLDMIASILWRINETWNLYFDIVAYMVMQPALGILNFLIFTRNRRVMATPEGRLLRKIVFCGFCRKNSTNDSGSTDGS